MAKEPQLVDWEAKLRKSGLIILVAFIMVFVVMLYSLTSGIKNEIVVPILGVIFAIAGAIVAKQWWRAS